MSLTRCCASCANWKINTTFGRCRNAKSPFFNVFTSGTMTACDRYAPIAVTPNQDDPRTALIEQAAQISVPLSDLPAPPSGRCEASDA